MSTICGKCQKDIPSSDVFSVEGINLHVNCYTCNTCNTLLFGKVFILIII